MMELWDVYDKDRNITGKTVERGTYILDSRINMTRLEPPLRVLHIFQLAC